MNECPLTGKPCLNVKNINLIENTLLGPKQLQCCQNCVIQQSGFVTIPLQPGALPLLPNPVQNIQNFMSKLGLKVITPTQQVFQSNSMPRCPVCSSTPVLIEQTGRFGCPNCYLAFKQDIEKMLIGHHGADRHVGKIPKNLKSRQESSKKDNVDRVVSIVKRHPSIPIEDRIAVLEEKIIVCVKIEDYERAALIRDVIVEMKKFFSTIFLERSSSETPSDVSSTELTNDE